MGTYPWLRCVCLAVFIMALPFSAALTAMRVELAAAEMVFQEDFGDPSLPRWQKGWSSGTADVTVTKTTGPDGRPAVAVEARKPTGASLSVALPIERIQGRAVVLEAWRKPDGIKTGDRHYYNAKSMLSWQPVDGKPLYSGVAFSDFSGTGDWERHMYVMKLPAKLKWARVTIGLQQCTGKASYAGLSVRIDPRFPDQQAVDRFLAEQERQFFEKLGLQDLKVERRPGGFLRVVAGSRTVPQQYWPAAVEELLLEDAPLAPEDMAAPSGRFAAALAEALGRRATDLSRENGNLTGAARKACVYEVASLRQRVSEILTGNASAKAMTVRVDGTKEIPVRPLVFGNNINAEHLPAAYDPKRGRFADGFLQRVRPMRITCMRYPGGCNADVFNWKEAIGPFAARGQHINYHHGDKRGPIVVGVDEFLRFCEAERMEPMITTAFLKDRPENIDLGAHPHAASLPYVAGFLRTAPERVELAADWVEYCNGSTDTTGGRRRAANGHAAPYGVKYWEVGNESYGPDRVGSTDAESYARAFPKYVEAMKRRDPSILVGMNGCGGRPEWNDPLLRISGRHADFFQIHIYLTPRVHNYAAAEGTPETFSECMRMADAIPARHATLHEQMKRRLGRTLPVFVTEFGMGNARNRTVMVSVTSAVLVADMIRAMLESPLVHGANKWTLYAGYWFSPVNGPTRRDPQAPYFVRPEHVMQTILARLRSDVRLAVDNVPGAPVTAIVFKRKDAYGVVLISREAVGWQQVRLALGGIAPGRAECFLMTAGHPLQGNDAGHELVREVRFTFDHEPGQPFLLPSGSVMGLLVPRSTR